MTTSGPTISYGGKEYDVNRDFSWGELLTVERLGGVPLARDDAFDSLSTMAAFVFVLKRRDDKSIEWESFLLGNISDLLGGDDEPEPEPKKPAAKKRPPKPAA